MKIADNDMTCIDAMLPPTDNWTIEVLRLLLHRNAQFSNDSYLAWGSVDEAPNQRFTGMFEAIIKETRSGEINNESTEGGRELYLFELLLRLGIFL